MAFSHSFYKITVEICAAFPFVLADAVEHVLLELTMVLVPIFKNFMPFALLDAFPNFSLIKSGLGLDFTLPSLETSLEIPQILNIGFSLICLSVLEPLFPLPFIDDVFVFLSSVVVEHDAVAVSLIISKIPLICILIG